MTATSGGLRAAKKERTRLEISHAATRLFLDQGFESTTIAEVAAAAGVSKMTVTNYFPRKEDLFFDRHREIVEVPMSWIAERAPGVSALDAVRDAYLDAVDRMNWMVGRVGDRFAQLIEDSPVLRARLREILEEREEALVTELLREQGAPASVPAGSPLPDEGVDARLAAAQLAAVLRLLFEEALRYARAGRAPEDFFPDLRRTAVRAFDRLRPSLGDFAIRRSEP